MGQFEEKITIYDIAKTVGVSKTTISRYLNGKYEYMSPETKQRIENTIKLTNYKPNNIARSLKSKSTKLIGLVVADIESPFVASMIKSIGDTLIKEGYNTIIVNSDNDFNKEEEYINMLITQRIDGLIINTTKNDNPFLIDLANKELPIVLADRFLKDYRLDISYVECDKSIKSALEHLESQGYRDIYFMTQPYYDISPRFLRVQAFLNYFKEKSKAIPSEKVLVVDADSNAFAIDKIREIVDSSEKELNPPAIICGNSTTLIDAVSAVNKLGLKMPKDIGVCGFDDWGLLPGVGYTSVINDGVTALVTNPRTIGINTANMILQRIKDKDAPKKSLEVPAELVIRSSTTLKAV